MRAIRSTLLVLLLLSAALSPATAASTSGVLGLTPAQVIAKLGRGALQAAYRPTRANTAIYLYCVGGTYYPAYYDVNTQRWVRERRPRRFGGETYGPCTHRDPGRPETFLVRYDHTHVTAVAYITAFAAARDEGWLGALDRAASGIDPYRTQGVRLRGPSDTDRFPKVTDVLRYRTGSTYVELEPVRATAAVIWYGPTVRVTEAKPFPSPEPLLELFGVLAARYGR